MWSLNVHDSQGIASDRFQFDMINVVLQRFFEGRVRRNWWTVKLFKVCVHISSNDAHGEATITTQITRIYENKKPTKWWDQAKRTPLNYRIVAGIGDGDLA